MKFHDYMAQVRPQTVKLSECWSICLFFFLLHFSFFFASVLCSFPLHSIYSSSFFSFLSHLLSLRTRQTTIIKYLTSLVRNEFKEYKFKPTTMLLCAYQLNTRIMSNMCIASQSMENPFVNEMHQNITFHKYIIIIIILLR